MEELGELVGTLPEYWWVILAAAFAGVTGFIMWRFVFHGSFNRKLAALEEKPQLGEIWIETLARTRSARWAERVLNFIPEKGLFTVFLTALQSRKCAVKFNAWLNSNPDLLALRKVALSGKGEDFNGKKARDLLAARMDQVREMAGDPEWSSRYMALKILLYDDDKRSERALWEAFHDPHSLIRRSVVEEFRPAEKELVDRIFPELMRLLLDDFVFEVRQAAKTRLVADFSNYYVLDDKGLSTVQVHHLLEQLDPAADTDHNFALKYLDGKNEELRLAAARFLDRAGVLKKLFTREDLVDRSAFERNKRLLLNAALVQELSFLDLLKKNDTPPSAGTLIIAAEILEKTGPVDLITALVKNTVQYDPSSSPDHREVYLNGLRTAILRGNEEAAKFLADRLLRDRGNSERLLPILESLTGRQGHIYVPAVLKLLEDDGFCQRDTLHEALQRFDSSLFLDRLLDIVSGSREEFSHRVRISAFKVIGMLGLPYCLQITLEHMPILPLEQARDFAGPMAKQGGTEFVRRVLDILRGDDGKVRAAVIAAVPVTEKKEFVKPIRDALGDADPQVRSAAARALLEYGDTRSVKEVREMLRDPVESVRREVSRALGKHGNAASLGHFKDLWDDENEVDSVKAAAIDGLRFSKLPEAVKILTGFLKSGRTPALEGRVIEALSVKSEKKELAELIEQLKDADHDLRSRIMQAFEVMGLEAEGLLVELLREDIVSLRPHITSVLEETGYVDFTIRKLSHRDPAVRRDAAELLSLIGSSAAFRGIVLAARDPDEQVRVMVTRALERLNSKEGKEILEQLQEDPDRKIRKYTLWALERMKARE